MSKKKKQESITTDDDYYPKYILESGGSVTINLKIDGNNNVIRLFSGQPPPNPKPPGH